MKMTNLPTPQIKTASSFVERAGNLTDRQTDKLMCDEQNQQVVSYMQWLDSS